MEGSKDLHPEVQKVGQHDPVREAQTRVTTPVAIWISKLHDLSSHHKANEKGVHKSVSNIL